jgi:hypothetical protein
MNSILLAALCGGLGGGVGALLGAGFDRLRKKPSRAAVILGGALAILAARLGPALISPPPTIEAQLEASGALYKTLHRYYPAAFAQLAGEFKAADLGDKIALENKVRPIIANLISVHMHEVDDATSAQMISFLVDEMRALRAKDPAACLDILSGDRVAVDTSTVIPPDLLRREDALTAQALEQAAAHPAPTARKLSQSEHDALVIAAFKQMSNADQTTVRPLLLTPRKPSNSAEQDALCKFNIDLFGQAAGGAPGTLRRFLVG